jgi:hypothetical protein
MSKPLIVESENMAKLNKVLADVESGILYDLMMGMAGSGEPHTLDTPEFDKQPGRATIETKPGK